MTKFFQICFLLLSLFSTSLAFSFSKDTILSDPSDTLQMERKEGVKKNDNLNAFQENMLLLDGKVKPKNKLIAVALALTLGPFGVHRLYLGTIPKVPIAYTLTLGGGFFILPLIDIFYIIGNRNPDLIEQNNHVFIWNKKKEID